MKEIEISWWLFEGRLRQGKNVLPDGLNWLCYFAGSSKSHCDNSISFIFLESPYQVDMKNVVKSSKHFFGYFNTLETHSGLSSELSLPATIITRSLSGDRSNSLTTFNVNTKIFTKKEKNSMFSWRLSCNYQI